MSDALFTTCAYCPRLCRHVCPVAVATGLEGATAAAMMAAPLLLSQGVFTPADALAGTSLCLDCGACTDHCKVHIPVAERLSAWRRPFLPAPAAVFLADIVGGAASVCVLTGATDWAPLWEAWTGTRAATLRTPDALGHTAWRRGALGVLAAVAAHLKGREVVTGSGAVEAVARAAGLTVHRLEPPTGEAHFRTCHEGPSPGPTQLACCGRRDAFPDREPDAARLVAEENVRLFAGKLVACADEECAAWLVAHGARVVGPLSSSAVSGVPDEL